MNYTMTIEALEFANDPSTGRAKLTALARSSDAYVRQAVAFNPNASVYALGLLARDSNVYVRQAVTSNPNAPLKALELLAWDRDAWVRWDAERRLLSDADRLTFDALSSDGWNGTLNDLLDTVAALAV